MIPCSPLPSIRLNGASIGPWFERRQPLVQVAVFLDDVSGNGHESPGLAGEPQIGCGYGPCGMSTGSDCWVKLRVSRTITAVWNCSERSNAAWIMANPSAGVAGSIMGISTIEAIGRVSWSFCEP